MKGLFISILLLLSIPIFGQSNITKLHEKIDTEDNDAISLHFTPYALFGDGEYTAAGLGAHTEIPMTFNYNVTLRIPLDRTAAISFFYENSKVESYSTVPKIKLNSNLTKFGTTISLYFR